MPVKWLSISKVVLTLLSNISTATARTLHPVVYGEKEVDNIGVEVAIQYTDAYSESIYSFANTIYTVDGGTHLTGLRAAVTRVINDYARRNNLLKDSDPNFSGDDTREGMTAIVSIKHPDPQFESQTKVKLMNPEAQTYVQQGRRRNLQHIPGRKSFRRRSPSSRNALPPLAPVTRPVRPAISSFVSQRWRALPCRVSWQTAPTAIPARPNSTS